VTHGYGSIIPAISLLTPPWGVAIIRLSNAKHTFRETATP